MAKMYFVFVLLVTGILQVMGQQTSNKGKAADNTTALPTGTYFIVNSKTNEALTPNGPTAGQNVFLMPFKKSGLQKWNVKQIKTKNGISYTIGLDGSDGLFLCPFPAGDHTPIITTPFGKEGSYTIKSASDNKGWYIKSLHLNGDAMQSFVYSKETPTEIRFNPAEAADKFYWMFIPVSD